METGRPYLSVVVAAYNEQPIIFGNLRRIVTELANHPDVTYELICVNDGSADATGQLMEEFAAAHPHVVVLHHRRNFGQGQALCTAFEQCRGEVVVTLDADLSYGPEYILRLVRTLDEKNVDIALASPYTSGGTVKNVPFYRHFLSRVGNAYLARMSPYAVRTSTCVVRAYRREVLDNLVLTSDGMELQLEILMKAALTGYRVCEVPARLQWTADKAAAADLGRTSKMRILRTIRLYLMLGWLSRPSALFMLGSLFLILPSLYMAGALLARVVQATVSHWGSGPALALSLGIQDVYAQYSYGIVTYGLMFVVGLHLFAFGMLVLQNKCYFDEQYKMAQVLAGRMSSIKRELEQSREASSTHIGVESAGTKKAA